MKKLPDNVYWRYKKSTPPKDEHPLNGEVKVVKPAVLKHPNLPHPFKCSKCDYVAPDRKASKLHWLDH